MALLSVDEALARVLDGVVRLGPETVQLHEAGGRVLAAALRARRAQPPFDASAMDGYAVRAADIAEAPTRLVVIGESAAGRRFSGRVDAGQAVRIFTGAPVPDDADTILIQENARSLNDGAIEATEPVAAGRHIRRAGLDFGPGETVLEDGRVLDPAALALAAAANHAGLPVVRRPLVAVLATGDELVAPGAEPGPDRIVASNSFGVAAMARGDGASALDLGIVPDDAERIAATIGKAREAGADVIVTLGGASVGDHDLVRPAMAAEGVEPGFWKIAMRPGKPLMHGRLGETTVLGLPGNPVSSLVCAQLFLRPLVARLAGRPYAPDMREAELATPLAENGPRRDYMRARVEAGPRGLVAMPFAVQDSSMLTTLAAADALLVREPLAPAAEAGARCSVLMLR